MFYRHLIIKDNDNNEVLYLFINNSFEFSKEFSNKNEEAKNEGLLKHIKNYLKARKVKFNGIKICLVVSGIIIGTIAFGGVKQIDLDLSVKPKTEYMVSLDKFNEIKIPIGGYVDVVIPVKEEEKAIDNNAIKEPVQSTTATPRAVTQKPTTSTTIVPTTPTPSPPPASSTPTPPPGPPPTSSTTTPPPVVEETKLVNPVDIHMVDGTIQTVSFEDFIVGVVAAEMPAAFNVEALKAQSVATRTYYLKALSQGKAITQINSGQITYKTTNDLKSLWSSSFDTYYSKVKNAVYSTSGEFITYNGSYIEAVYCSTNNGRTESSLDVWGNYYPYLISVDSSWDINASSYLREIDKDLSIIISILGIPINETTSIEVISRTDNNSIKEISIGGTVFTGLYLRSALGLRSTDFDLSIIGNTMHITTKGYGHGVGMSQYGANGMGNEGYSYRQILNHYYPNTAIQK